MVPSRPAVPVEIEVFRGRPRWRHRLGWLLAAVSVSAPLIWLMVESAGAPGARSDISSNTAQVAGPPWQLGNPQGRFTLNLYADLECPFCRAYFPQLRRWVGEHGDVELQWHHLPLAAHEPAASAEARLAECAGEAGGSAAFWKAVEWIYAHTRGDGLGLPEGLRYPDLTSAIEQCMASKRIDAVIRAQVREAAQGGVTATPSLRLHDRKTGKEMLLQGPIEGDALLSAMDMLAAGAAATTSSTEMPADVVGDMPR